jgi:hypothetical protein
MMALLILLLLFLGGVCGFAAPAPTCIDLAADVSTLITAIYAANVLPTANIVCIAFRVVLLLLIRLLMVVCC